MGQLVVSWQPLRERRRNRKCALQANKEKNKCATNVAESCLYKGKLHTRIAYIPTLWSSVWSLNPERFFMGYSLSCAPRLGRCPPWSTPVPTPPCPTRRRNPKGCGRCRGQRGFRQRRSVWGRRCGGATWTPRWWCWGKPGRGESRAGAAQPARAGPPARPRPAACHWYAAIAARWAHSWNPSWGNKWGKNRSAAASMYRQTWLVTVFVLTRRCAAPTAAPAAGWPGKAQTSGGSSHRHSSRSRGSDGRNAGHSADTSGSALISLAAAWNEDHCIQRKHE